jgi:hypothetical protein
MHRAYYLPVRLMIGADSWLQAIFFPLAVAGLISKVKQSAAARAMYSDAQKGRCLIPW